jgi:hypothetical protein
MPRELSPSEEREYDDYRSLGPASEVRSRVGKLAKVQAEAAESRKRIEALEKENETLKAKAPDGAVVLTGEDAKAYEAASAAHGGIAGLAKKAERTEALEAEAAKRGREDGLADAGEAEGWDRKNTVKALTRDAEFAALPFEVREVEREVQSGTGKTEKRTVRAGFVTVEGRAVPLAEWVQKHAEHILPGLTGGNGNAQQQAGGGREFVEQRGRSSPEVKSGDAKARAKAQNQEAASRPNALRPASNNA